MYVCVKDLDILNHYNPTVGRLMTEHAGRMMDISRRIGKVDNTHDFALAVKEAA